MNRSGRKPVCMRLDMKLWRGGGPDWSARGAATSPVELIHHLENKKNIIHIIFIEIMNLKLTRRENIFFIAEKNAIWKIRHLVINQYEI